MGLDYFYIVTKQIVLCMCESLFWGWFCFDLFGDKRKFTLCATGMKQHFLLIHWFGCFSKCNISKPIPISWTDCG